MPIEDIKILSLNIFSIAKRNQSYDIQNDIEIYHWSHNGAVYTRHPWGHCIDTRQYDNKAPPCPAVPTTAGEELPLTAAAAAGHD